MQTKTLARISSIQALYQYVICTPIDLNKLTLDIVSYYNSDNKKHSKYYDVNLNFFCEIIKFAISDFENLDRIIKENLSPSWNINNIHLTLLSLLRCAIAELVFFPETPIKVIINEYTTISTMMLSSGEESFVNAILQNISKKLIIEKKENEVQ